jgi:hypothetical protein
MEQQINSAYRLTWEIDYLENCDEEYELELEEFPGSEWIPGLIETIDYKLPNPVIFWGNPEFLNYLDYPTSNVSWPIMSKRMYCTLLAVGDFPHRMIPIAMMDGTKFTFESERRFLPNGQPNPEITNMDALVAVQILEESNYFDFERSEYKRHPRNPEWVDSVEKYVLNEPEGRFPPLFRLNVMSSALFISAKARVALLEAGIRGTAYHCLDDGYSLQNEVDIPVELPAYF